MKQIPTEELDNILENTHPDQTGEYLRHNKKYMTGEKKSFYYYMKDVLSEKNIRLKDVYTYAGVAESYGSKIIEMEKRTRDRDLIIRLCVAGHFTWDETSRALKLYGFSPLYSKEPKDACIIVALNNRIYDVYRINELLTEQGLEPLMRE